MEIRIAHTLTPEQVSERLQELARDNDVVFESTSPANGTLEKRTPLGAVNARYAIAESELVLTVEKRPAFLPEGTVRQLLEDGLRKAFGG